MCGIACSLNYVSSDFDARSLRLLHHRGPNDNGSYHDADVSLLQTRLSILELTSAGHQPMHSSCGRYIISYNGEIYNHRELRRQYLSTHNFHGDSDTETIIELFRLQKQKMLTELVGMWAILIWDTQEKILFISRDRYGQKPLYYRSKGDHLFFASEIKPLLQDGEQNKCETTAVVEFLALSNYGHLKDRTFYSDIRQLEPGCYAFIKPGQTQVVSKRYWVLPEVSPRDKRPLDEKATKQLHDIMVEAVLSQTLSDVPIGITLSGGIDSSIIAGILATYYDQDINAFTAQAVGSAYDESRYVDAVVKKFPRINLHRFDSKELSLKADIIKYVGIQEEPFGDPSIIAHGYLMQAACDNGIKVMLGGQGADELFFGYTNMTQAVLQKQLSKLHFSSFLDNVKQSDISKSSVARSIFLTVFPGLERKLRNRSRVNRRAVLEYSLSGINDELFSLPTYDDFYGVWCESVYGIHLPHLVHYDDRNAMATSIEGRMPFLDHRISEFVATIRPEYFFKEGKRKYPIRMACSQYLPDEVQNRRDKIGFHTPLIDAIYKDADWVCENIADFIWIKSGLRATLLNKVRSGSIDISDAMLIVRALITNCWMQQFNIVG
ncbi:asparagine synthase (glutamine-hydrolyzing) [Polluticoccus soli]|uniref:asparagine synthase (glutamine-hydrolyzing) n=1 Tax=Polluticoccus soli TaxID=3034150 RepID=UPI0023E310DD|nr:asparagine synthase (glutamine-hydrolyzing) [Flavipsychrobacter sp. JY13-12]